MSPTPISLPSSPRRTNYQKQFYPLFIPNTKYNSGSLLTHQIWFMAFDQMPHLTAGPFPAIFSTRFISTTSLIPAGPLQHFRLSSSFQSNNFHTWFPHQNNFAFYCKGMETSSEIYVTDRNRFFPLIRTTTITFTFVLQCIKLVLYFNTKKLHERFLRKHLLLVPRVIFCQWFREIVQQLPLLTVVLFLISCVGMRDHHVNTIYYSSFSIR
jgi:hypothetical protein